MLFDISEALAANLPWRKPDGLAKAERKGATERIVRESLPGVAIQG
jgi:hypothetical protein